MKKIRTYSLISYLPVGFEGLQNIIQVALGCVSSAVLSTDGESTYLTIRTDIQYFRDRLRDRFRDILYIFLSQPYNQIKSNQLTARKVKDN